jgi:hypothetical protein
MGKYISAMLFCNLLESTRRLGQTRGRCHVDREPHLHMKNSKLCVTSDDFLYRMMVLAHIRGMSDHSAPSGFNADLQAFQFSITPPFLQ